MKNQLLNQLSEKLKNEQYGIDKLHNILDNVIDTCQTFFNKNENGPQLMWAPRDEVFVFPLSESTHIRISRNFVTLAIDLQVVQNENDVMAIASLNTQNQYREEFSRMPKELKSQITELFGLISDIDINNVLTDENAAPKEEATSIPASEVDVIEPDTPVQ